eukprot:1699291-Pyramimonas_sp.AAC.1
MCCVFRRRRWIPRQRLARISGLALVLGRWLLARPGAQGSRPGLSQLEWASPQRLVLEWPRYICLRSGSVAWR